MKLTQECINKIIHYVSYGSSTKIEHLKICDHCKMPDGYHTWRNECMYPKQTGKEFILNDKLTKASIALFKLSGGKIKNET